MLSVMPRRGGQAHVATITTKGKGGKVYTSYLLRRSYRKGGKVRHENLGNLSHLPREVIEAIRKMLQGRVLVDLDEQFQIESTLARRHLSDGGFVLYDLSSSYVEGRCCPLAALGHNRDGRQGKLQVNWGLVCSPEGRPVSVRVHPGNTADPTTVPGVIDAVKERFQIERVILVGDRAMITDAHAATLKELGAGFVSALKTAQIRKLLSAGELQLSLFDERNLAEISSPQFPGERLVLCRNPHLAAERARKREDLLGATERELENVRQMVDGPRGTLRNATAGKIGERAGRVSNKYKVAKHFELGIAERSFHYQRKTEQIAAEAA